jgi:hypothetical protein
MNAAELAHILGGDVVGRRGRNPTVFAPGPGLPTDDRSLIVESSWDEEDGLLIVSSVGDHAAAREHVRKLTRTKECKARNGQT